MRTALLLSAVVAAGGCSDSKEGDGRVEVGDEAKSEGAEWLRGDVDARFALVARHLRGFDMAMVEVGYRYTELYWAGRDRNWDYAAYQLGKVETAVRNGLERRPKRAASAKLLDPAVARVRAAIEGHDGAAMDGALEKLTETCNACHEAEQVAFIEVAPPAVRLSPVDPTSEASEQEEAAVGAEP